MEMAEHDSLCGKFLETGESHKYNPKVY